MHRQIAPVVLKLGGSLLDLPDLQRRLEGVLRLYVPSPLLIVVGGGAVANLVREWDRLHRIGEETAHRLALEAMSLSARCVASLLPNAELVDRAEDCAHCWESNRAALVNAAVFVPSLERASGDPLPHTWDVTSDSISAWIAGRLSIDRLVLIKSVDLPTDAALRETCNAVDPSFRAMCRGVPRIEWINLRSEYATPRVSLFE